LRPLQTFYRHVVPLERRLRWHKIVVMPLRANGLGVVVSCKPRSITASGLYPS
jgi:hypothetical protein